MILPEAGVGITKSALGALSAPQMLVRYLAKKFPEFGKRIEGTGGVDSPSYKSPTFLEHFQNMLKETGMQPQTKEEQAMQDVGSLFGIGKGLGSIGSKAGRVGTLAAEEGGRGADPLQAALMGAGGEFAASKLPQVPEQASNLGSSLVEGIKSIPEIAGEIPEKAGLITGGALESVADLASKAHIPGAQPTLGALASYIKHISVSPEKAAQRKLFADITPELLPLINERLNAAQRLNLSYLTPAEATLSPFEAAKQGIIGKTSEGSRKLFEKGRERSESEQKAIETLQDNIYDPEKLAPEKKAQYEKAMSASVPPEFIEKWSADPVVGKAIKQIGSQAEYKRAARNMSPDSFEYWNLVKRVVGDLETEDPKGTRKTKSDEATKARKEMVAEMDEIQPEYAIARKIAEREFTRKEIEDFFDKRNMSGNEFQKFIKSKKQYNKLMDKLEPYPEAQQNLKDMQLLFGDLIPSDPSIRTAAQMKKTSMWDARNKLDALKQDLDERYGKKHDVAAVNLMTDPRWIDMLVEYLGKKRSK
jgi:hypothetical protein